MYLNNENINPFSTGRSCDVRQSVFDYDKLPDEKKLTLLVFVIFSMEWTTQIAHDEDSNEA